MSPRWTLCADGGFQRLSGHRWGDERRAVIAPAVRRRVGTIPTSAAEVRDRSRTAHGAFYATITLPGGVLHHPGREGVNSSIILQGRMKNICVTRAGHAHGRLSAAGNAQGNGFTEP